MKQKIKVAIIILLSLLAAEVAINGAVSEGIVGLP